MTMMTFVLSALPVLAQSVPVESITITTTQTKIAVGGSRTYAVQILPAEAAAGATVEWSSSEPRVATIDAKGKMRGMAPGNTVIRATCGGKTAEKDLTVAIKAAKVGQFLFDDGTWEAGSVVDGKTCIGLIYFIAADGKSGKAVSLDEAVELKWSEAQAAVPNAKDALNGEANCEEIAKIEGWKTAFPAAKWCVDKSNDKVKWHLPAVDELRQLFAASCGLTWVEKDADASKNQINNWTGNSVTMVYKDGQPDTNPYPEARNAFNANLKKAKGGVELAADKYWSSTMYNDEFATFLSFEGGFSQAQPKQYFHVCRTRAIANFSEPKPITSSVAQIKADGALEVRADGESVMVSSPKEIKAIAVYSVSGAMMLVDAAIDGAKATFSTAMMTNGVYVVTVVTVDGSKMTAKIVK